MASKFCHGCKHVVGPFLAEEEINIGGIFSPEYATLKTEKYFCTRFNKQLKQEVIGWSGFAPMYSDYLFRLDICVEYGSIRERMPFMTEEEAVEHYYKVRQQIREILSKREE